MGISEELVSAVDHDKSDDMVKREKRERALNIISLFVSTVSIHSEVKRESNLSRKKEEYYGSGISWSWSEGAEANLIYFMVKGSDGSDHDDDDDDRSDKKCVGVYFYKYQHQVKVWQASTGFLELRYSTRVSSHSSWPLVPRSTDADIKFSLHRYILTNSKPSNMTVSWSPSL
ncbi:unnamed protein product [Orchesella dallaii]|uniref:Uncharacterized protein n=1 Tax=Orchesella dallaii TaxID=48710 RepID=A0ABP1R6F2_9HEXA